MTSPFADTSLTPFWYEARPARAPLTGEIDADVAIVGAGFTGLWTAYYLSVLNPAARVVVVEQHHVGFGASGRNGGWASAIFPLSLARVARQSSHEAALALQDAMNDTVREIGRVVESEGIEADYAREGYLSLARSPAQFERAQRTARASAEFGLPAQWQVLSASEAHGRVGATEVRGGLYTEHCALVHPGRLVRGLAEVVERRGVTIFEGSTAVHVEPRQVVTDRGAVRARTIVVATEGYTSQLAGRRRDIVPLYSLVLATEQLAESTRRELGLTHRIGFNDMRNMRIYAQTTSDGRLVFGGRGAPYHFASRISPDFDNDERIHAKIRAAMAELFPSLAGVGVEYRWGGALGVPRDWHPSVGLDPVTGLAWAGGFVGDGVTTSNLAARVLADLITGIDSDITRLPLVNHRSPRWEWEPFRWFGVNAGLAAASISDAEEARSGRPSRVAGFLERLTGAH